MKSKMMSDCKSMILDACNDGRVEGLNACDVHNEVFNTDYFEVYTNRAIDYMGGNAWECIETVQEYEKDNFGEVNTELSDPSKVLNMYAYIIGEEAISEISVISDNWDKTLDSEDVKAIIEELEA